MHAAIDAREVDGEVAQPEAAVREGIEEPDLDVRMRIERSDRRVEAAGVRVVEQHAHPNAALGRLPDGFPQQLAGGVAVPDVVLHVEAAVRGSRQQDPGGEGICAHR